MSVKSWFLQDSTSSEMICNIITASVLTEASRQTTFCIAKSMICHLISTYTGKQSQRAIPAAGQTTAKGNHDSVLGCIVAFGEEQSLRRGSRSTDLATTVDSLCIWEDQLHFLGKLHQPGAGVSGGCDKDFRIPLFSMGILIINVAPRDCSVVVFQVYLLPQGLLFLTQLCRNGLPLCRLQNHIFLSVWSLLVELELQQ